MDNYASSDASETLWHSNFARGQADWMEVEHGPQGIFADVDYGEGTHLPYTPTGSFANGQAIIRWL